MSLVREESMTLAKAASLSYVPKGDVVLPQNKLVQVLSLLGADNQGHRHVLNCGVGEDS